MLSRVELEVYDSDKELVYRGNYEDYLEMNDYDSNLTELIARLSGKRENEVYFTNDLGEEFLLVNSNEFEEEGE